MAFPLLVMRFARARTRDTPRAEDAVSRPKNTGLKARAAMKRRRNGVRRGFV